MGAKVAKHAPNPQVGDGVTILFDTPFANGDDPAKVSYELVRAGFKTGIKKTRADGTERVDDRHVALHFEGLKKGVYSLLRTDERGTPATIFSNVPYNPDGQPASKLDTGLTRGKAVRPTGVQGTYWTWTDVPPNPPNLDPDLKYDLTDLKDAIDSHEPKKPTWKAVKDEDRIKVPDVKDEHYAEACAVFTRPVSFVEWKTYAIPVGENDKKRWFPFGISRDKEDGYRDRAKASAWKELGNERYIYVFRENYRQGGASTWVEELKVGADGVIHAAAVKPQLDLLAKMTAPDSKKPVPKSKDPDPAGRSTTFTTVGKTLSFARRVNGWPTLHYFFASDVRLPLSVVHQLMLNASDWLPAYTFQQDDPNVVGERNGALLVAVIDPLTITRYLHAYAFVAANDYTDYCADKSQRQAKVMLGQVLKTITDADAKLYNLLHDTREGKKPGKSNFYVLGEFLDQYYLQTALRRRWRTYWNFFLASWLDSAPFAICAAAHESVGGKPLADFIITFSEALPGLSSSGNGRDLLLRMWNGTPNPADPKWKFISTHMFLEKRSIEPPEWEMLEKASGLTMEALSEWGPLVTKGISPTAVVDAISKRTGVTIRIVQPTKQAVKPLPQFWGNKDFEFAHYELTPGQDKSLKPAFKNAKPWIELTLKVISAAFALGEIKEALKDDKNAVAVAKILHTAGDLGSASSELVSHYKKRASDLRKSTGRMLEPEAEALAKKSLQAWEGAFKKFALLAALTDFFVGLNDTVESFEHGDTGEAVGHLIATVGYGMEALAAIGLLAESSVLGPIGWVGSALVIAGNAIYTIYHKTDTEKFIIHCCWGGGEYEPPEKAEWAVEGEKWSDERGRYDLQLASLIQILAKFGIEQDDVGPSFNTAQKETASQKLRVFKLKMGWVPAGARIELTYEERWANPSNNRAAEVVWEFTEAGEVKLPDDPEYDNKVGKDEPILMADTSKNEYVVWPNPKKVVFRPDLVVGSVPAVPAGFSNKFLPLFNSEFKKLSITARLKLPIGAKESVLVPSKEPKEFVV